MMDSHITLREGLLLFRSQYKDSLSHKQGGITEEAKAFFRSHDIAHVLFGCDISLYGEGAVKIWTIFGTTLGFWNHIKGYQAANAYSLSQNFSVGHVFRNVFKLLGAIPIIIFRAYHMSRKWPWSDFETYLDIPIHEIRKKYNIRVL